MHPRENYAKLVLCIKSLDVSYVATSPKLNFLLARMYFRTLKKKNMCYTVTKITLMLHFNIYIIIYRAYKWLLFSKKNILIITNFVIVFEVSWGVLTGTNAQL